MKKEEFKFGLDCRKCKKRKQDPFDSLEGLCVLCKAKGILKRMDKRYWFLARVFNGVLK